jgi:LysM repeat protein
MKSQMLPVKRRPVSNGLLRRLNAVTNSRRQRVAAGAAASSATELETEDGSSKISRALTIIFLIHIVAIALIFVHQRFLDGRAPAETSVVTTAPKEVAPAAANAQRRDDLPRLSSGEKPYIVRTGDNYARIAAAEGVDEGDLRHVNGNVDIGPGLILKVPPKRIIAEDPPEVAAIRQQTPSDHDRGLVEAMPVDVSNAPRAQLVRPAVSHAAAPAASGKTYVVQPGDSIFRIASRHKVSQQSLMRANGISDPKKMKTGMKLTIPLE